MFRNPSKIKLGAYVMDLKSGCFYGEIGVIQNIILNKVVIKWIGMNEQGSKSILDKDGTYIEAHDLNNKSEDMKIISKKDAKECMDEFMIREL